MQPGDVVALNNGRTAACSASILTATPTITGPCLLGNVRVKAEIDRRVDAYSRAAAIESAGKDDRGLDLIRYRKQFNGTTSYVAVAADWLARTGADDSVQGPYREARCGARSPRSETVGRNPAQRQPDELQWLLLDCGYGRSGSKAPIRFLKQRPFDQFLLLGPPIFERLLCRSLNCGCDDEQRLLCLDSGHSRREFLGV